MFCPKCGVEISDESNFCPKCGYEIKEMDEESKRIKNDSEKILRPVQEKRMAVTIILSFVYTGLGHLYLNQTKRGLIFIGIGTVFVILSFVDEWMGLTIIPFYIWVIYDSYKQCKIYNQYVREMGKNPEW